MPFPSVAIAIARTLIWLGNILYTIALVNEFFGVCRSADNEVAVSLLRTPRVVRSDHIVRAYDSYEAKGNQILKQLDRPLMRYSGHVFTKRDQKGVVIVTQK